MQASEGDVATYAKYLPSLGYMFISTQTSFLLLELFGKECNCETTPIDLVR